MIFLQIILGPLPWLVALVMWVRYHVEAGSLYGGEKEQPNEWAVYYTIQKTD